MKTPCHNCDRESIDSATLRREADAFFARHRVKEVDTATREMRLAACETCENRVGETCRVCGCLIDVRVRMAAKECPASPAKWPKGHEPRMDEP